VSEVSLGWSSPIQTKLIIYPFPQIETHSSSPFSVCLPVTPVSFSPLPSNAAASIQSPQSSTGTSQGLSTPTPTPTLTRTHKAAISITPNTIDGICTDNCNVLKLNFFSISLLCNPSFALGRSQIFFYEEELSKGRHSPDSIEYQVKSGEYYHQRWYLQARFVLT